MTTKSERGSRCSGPHAENPKGSVSASSVSILPRPETAFASIKRAAEYAGVSDKTVRRWISRGQIDGFRVGERLIRVDLRQVDGLMRQIPTMGAVSA